MKLLPLILMLAGCAAVPVTQPPTFPVPPLRITDSVQSAVQPEVGSLRLVNTSGANWVIVYPPAMNPARFTWKVLTKSDLTQSRWTEEPSETDSDATIIHTNGRPNLFIRIVGEPKS